MTANASKWTNIATAAIAHLGPQHRKKPDIGCGHIAFVVGFPVLGLRRLNR